MGGSAGPCGHGQACTPDHLAVVRLGQTCFCSCWSAPTVSVSWVSGQRVHGLAQGRLGGARGLGQWRQVWASSAPVQRWVELGL